MGIQTFIPVRRLQFNRTCTTLYLVLLFSILLIGATGVSNAEETQSQITSDNSNAEKPVSQVRYRTRPVTAFRSGPKPTNNNSSTANSSETDGPETSGAPFIAVHDLTSQTFERLQENWKNLETFIRNLQARRSQEESLRSPTSSLGGGSSPGGETVRRPPYNNVYTFRYHPVVLEGEGSSNLDDAGGSTKGSPTRPFNGISFNPLPFDPKGEGSKSIAVERHTVATIYTIGICLTIMAIGSVMFILINKCDGTGGSNYMRTSTVAGAGSRITRSVIGAARGGRPQNGGINNGRNRNGRTGRSTNENSQASTSANIIVSGGAEGTAKSSIDLPPSYDSLFPAGVPKLAEVPEEVVAITETVINDNPNANSTTTNENARSSEASNV